MIMPTKTKGNNLLHPWGPGPHKENFIGSLWCPSMSLCVKKIFFEKKLRCRVYIDIKYVLKSTTGASCV